MQLLLWFYYPLEKCGGQEGWRGRFRKLGDALFWCFMAWGRTGVGRRILTRYQRLTRDC